MFAGFITAASFSLSDALANIPEGTLIVLLVFIISFAILFFALNRAFRDNVPIATVISFALSFGITYGVNKSGVDLSGWVYDIGISSDMLSILIPILAIALAIFLILKLKKDSLFIFGGFLLASSLFVYEKAIVIVIGVVLILIRLFIGRDRYERELSRRDGRHRKVPWWSSRKRDERHGMVKYLKRLHRKKQRELRNLSPLRRRSRYHDIAASIKDELREIERRLRGYT